MSALLLIVMLVCLIGVCACFAGAVHLGRRAGVRNVEVLVIGIITFVAVFGTLLTHKF